MNDCRCQRSHGAAHLRTDAKVMMKAFPRPGTTRPGTFRRLRSYAESGRRTEFRSAFRGALS